MSRSACKKDLEQHDEQRRHNAGYDADKSEDHAGLQIICGETRDPHHRLGFADRGTSFLIVGVGLQRPVLDRPRLRPGLRRAVVAAGLGKLPLVVIPVLFFPVVGKNRQIIRVHFVAVRTRRADPAFAVFFGGLHAVAGHITCPEPVLCFGVALLSRHRIHAHGFGRILVRIRRVLRAGIQESERFLRLQTARFRRDFHPQKALPRISVVSGPLIITQRQLILGIQIARLCPLFQII